jgi:hypothetical protein
MSQPLFVGYSMDGSGNLVAMGGNRVGDIQLLDAATNALRTAHLNLQGSEDFRLSGDRQRLAFGGIFPEANFLRAFGILDLASQSITQGPASSATNFFTTDRTGRWLAFQSNVDLDPSVGNLAGTLQYYLYNDDSKEVRQLTKDPEAIDYQAPCPTRSGTTPAISRDGTAIALVTSALLGVAPAEAGTACHVFAYDVPTGQLRYVAALPQGAVFFGAPSISDDGEWLSFATNRVIPPGILRSLPALLNMHSGDMIEPLGGVSEFPGFDSVVTGDGSTVVLSTQTDVDPRVGNVDHNMEIVSYDLATGRFTQVSETTASIGHFPGGCEQYRPRVSTDGHVVVFGFMLYSVERCQLDGPQRNEADGFVFKRVRAARKRPGNRAPVLQPVTDAHVVAGNTLTLDFAATDPDRDPVVFFAQVVGGADIPSGSSIEDHRNGSATLTWPTTPEQIGTCPMRVAAFDEGGGETMHDFTITVCDRVVTDDGLPGIVAAIFESGSEPPPTCHDAELNHDGAITAADVVKAVAEPTEV